jgi:hypothetical protein
MNEESIELTGTQLITLDPKVYVTQVFAPFRERLDKAKADAAGITPDATTKEGMVVAIKQRAIFRTLRVEVENARKARKAPILEISRLLDGRAKELEYEITYDEDRFDGPIVAEQTRKERERVEREAAEAARLSLFQACLAEIIAKPGAYIGKPSSTINVALADMRAHDVTTWATDAAWFDQANEAKANCIGALENLHFAALASEAAAKAEAERIIADRAELDRLRAEQEERDRQESAKRAEDELKAREAREKIEAEERASREKIEAQERAARLAREEEDRIAREKREAERKKQKEEAAAEAKRQAEVVANQRAEQERIDATRRETERLQNELLDGASMLRKFVERFGKRREFTSVVKAINAYLATVAAKADA